MPRTNTRLTTVVLIASALIIVGCNHRHKKEPAPAALRVEVATAKADSVQMRYSFVTHLRSNYDVVVQPRVNGYLQRIAYDAGMPVKRGQLLFEIDANLLKTTLLAARAALSSAEAEALEARNNYERAVPLAELNAISRSQLDQYTAAYNSAVASVESARQQLQSADLQVGYATIYSPINGIVAASSAHKGDYVGPGTQFSSLTTISNIDTLKADIAIPTSLYLSNAGKRSMYENRDLISEIKLTLADNESYSYAGSYDYTQQRISTTSGTVTLVVTFPNPDYRLKGGEYGRVEFGLGKQRSVILVPQQAVQRQQGIESVWVVKSDNTVEYREVKTGETIGRDWIIEQGLQAGEEVVVTGKEKLRSGAHITPIKDE